MEQQHDATSLGMWIFLATEMMFFGGLFPAYTSTALQYLAAFAAGQPQARHAAGRHQHRGADLLSSLTMALAVRAAQTGAASCWSSSWC